jgi:hypothetical protein
MTNQKRQPVYEIEEEEDAASSIDLNKKTAS